MPVRDTANQRRVAPQRATLPVQANDGIIVRQGLNNSVTYSPSVGEVPTALDVLKFASS